MINISQIQELLDKIEISFKKRVTVIHQTESSECGLACLAMICKFYGKNIDLISLRQKFNLSARGTTLSSLIGIADKLELASRPLTLELDEINKLKMPCIIHWDFNHFVILHSIQGNLVSILDPAQGRKTLKTSELSKSFTGVALEVWPNSKFTKDKFVKKINIKRLIGSVQFLKQTLFKLFFLSIVIDLINLFIPIGTQLVMDHVVPSNDLGLLSLICICLFIIIIFKSFVGMIRSISTLTMTTLINIQWKFGLLGHLLNLPLSYFERRKLGDIQSRFNSLDNVREILTSGIVEALMDITMLIAVTVMMFFYGSWLVWLVFLFALLFLLVRLFTYNIYHNLTEEWIIRDARTRSYFMETLYGIATIKTQGMPKKRSNTWLNLNIDTLNTEVKIKKMDLIYGGLNTFIAASEQILILWFGINLIISNEMTIGMFIAFGIFREQFSNRIYYLTNYLVRLKMISIHNERISDIALNETENQNENNLEYNSHSSSSIELININYKYDEQSEFVLKEINIKIQAGESVAIVGRSGSGKTTLMKVMCSLLKPSSGTILFNDLNINLIGVDNYRKQIGCVLQDDRLFSGTIRENICGFEDTFDDDWMIECSKLSYSFEFINKMPMKFDTLIGELGEGLSGGQKQRIFIARALYRRPSIIYMDEATSSLDTESEAYINKSMKNLNITRIIIAHRESTVDSADRIINIT